MMSYSLFFPGRRVRAHLQNPATKCDFPIGYFIFLLTLEKCAILQCSVLSIRSKLPFLFHRDLVFLSCFVCILCCVRLFIKKNSSLFLEVKKFLYVNKMS
jgi:glucan phosphoethanolaminetransferase (alkaline phosphatase superfamily)